VFVGIMSRLLTPELVPKTSWYSNVRSEVSRDVWDAIRSYFRKPSCQYCGAKTKLFCHEVWKYDDVNYIQKLTDFRSICGMCHHIKHLGLAGLMAKRGDLDYSQLIRHYCAVNGCTEADFLQDREETFELWRERSSHEWTVDISYLDSLNIVSVRAWMKAHPDEVQSIKEHYPDVLTQ